MQVTEEQRRIISQWVAQGHSIAQIQQLLRDELGISMTYMDARFLLDDLDIELPETPVPETKTKEQDSVLQESSKTTPESGAAEPDDLEWEVEPPSGSLRLEVDRLTRPGTMVSGSVTFSDGVSAKWALDSMGRLLLEGAKKGYQPSASDLQEFQRLLTKELEKSGF